MKDLNSKETLEKVLKYQKTGDKETLADLFKLYEPVVKFLIKKHHNYNISNDDLYQECYLHMITAFQKFDSSLGSKLSSYVILLIRGKLFDYVSDHMQPVKMHTTKPQRKAFYNVNKTARKYNNDESFALSNVVAKKVAEELNISVKEVEEMYYRLNAGSVSLNSTTNDSDDNEVMDILCQEAKTPESIFEKKETSEFNIRKLMESVNNLSDRQRMIILEKHLTDDKVTLTDLGKKCGISAEAIRQNEARALKILKEDVVMV